MQEYFARNVCLAAATGNSNSSDENKYVDGMFTDDTGGIGQEHVAVISAVDLTDHDISNLQLRTQQSWMKALSLLTSAGKYIPQAYRTTRPLNINATKAGATACTQWMRTQCAVPANESTQTYPPVEVGEGPEALEIAKVIVAAFLVSRGPYSYLSAPFQLINDANWQDQFFLLHRLDTGLSVGECQEGVDGDGIFFRRWSKGTATVNCTAGRAILNFSSLEPP